jgi:hypothetical protein
MLRCSKRKDIPDADAAAMYGLQHRHPPESDTTTIAREHACLTQTPDSAP